MGSAEAVGVLGRGEGQHALALPAGRPCGSPASCCLRPLLAFAWEVLHLLRLRSDPLVPVPRRDFSSKA